MSPQPEPYQQTPATTAGQHRTDESAARFLDSIEQIMQRANHDIAAEQTPHIPTVYRDTTQTPTIGSAAPVAQPGRPPMSQKATDDSVRLLSFGGMVLLSGGGVGLVMVASGYADPTVIGVSCAGLTALLLAVSRLMRRTKETLQAAPPQITQHYTGDVYQHRTTVTSNTKGLIARTHNDPRL